MTKILFLIESLGGGGAERVLVNLVNHMDPSQYDITVETMFNGGVNSGRLAPHIRYIENHSKAVRGISRLYKLFPSSILYKKFVGDEYYDIVVSYIQGPPLKVLAGCKNKKTKKITWLHCENSGNFFRTCWLFRKNAIKAYERCDAICGVSKKVIDDFEAATKITHNTYVVYNTNDSDYIRQSAAEPVSAPFKKDRPYIVTAGRLAVQKAYDRLVAVAKRLKDEGYRFDIAILGTGAQKQPLEEQIAELGVDDCVHMLGFCKNPYSIMSESDFFVCSSRWEGLSTVVSEAVILGLPVVSTDVSGAKEVLGEHDEYGIVVENSEDGVYLGMKKLLDDESLLPRYREMAKQRAQFFDTKASVARTEAFFKQILG